MVQFSLFGMADAKIMTGEYISARQDTKEAAAERMDMHPIHWIWDEPMRRYTEMGFDPISYKD